MYLGKRIKKIEKEISEIKKATEKPAAIARITADSFIISRDGVTLLRLSKF
ncbi:MULTISPECIES: hypothetical protein [Kosakonia]|uniref:hypothetical protein n=1 Tax=Kosakonia TaxID=1330547 RepID=UPI000E079313|nr:MULTISPECIES: hypothetical protein [Kosakonia]RCX01887.1 hypothetical protein DFO56_104613 [Kosakonia sp. AG348]